MKDPISLTALAYIGALMAGTPIAQALAPGVPLTIMVPAASGAVIAAAFTVKPIFDAKDDRHPAAVALLGAITLFVGFVFSFAFSQPLNELRTPALGPLAPLGPIGMDPWLAAGLCGFAGEKMLWLLWQIGPKGWLALARKALPGGGK